MVVNKVIEVAITTVDNPHDPFTEFVAWFNYDVAAGYYTTSTLARLVKDSPELSSADSLLAQELAIDEMVSENILGIYRKVTREVSDPFDEENLNLIKD